MSGKYENESEALFMGMVSSFVTNGLINLGEQINPLTGKKTVNANQATYSIKMLEMIKAKTNGNLSENEQEMINSAVTKLKMRFVSINEN